MTEPVQPLRVDLAKVAGYGTAAWGIALVITLVLAATDRASWTPVAVCGVGAFLGFAGIWWSHGHDDLGRRRRRSR